MEWIKCSEREPEESGMYIVCMPIADAGYVTNLRFSKVHHSWAVRDEYTPDLAQTTAMHPAYWQPFPELPEGVKAC